MAAGKTFVIKAAQASGSYFGSLQDGGSVATATTTTGWVVSTNLAGLYADMAYGNSANAWSGTALPAPPLSNGISSANAWRSEAPISGTFETGAWTIATAVIATSAASGSGRIRVRLWRDTSPTGATASEVTTSTIDMTDWTNLLVGTQQNTSGTQTIPGFTLASEYLFVQMAMYISAQSVGATANAFIRADSTNSKLTTARFTESLSGGGVTSPWGAGSKIWSQSLAAGASSPVIARTYYQMRGWYAAGSTYETWVAVGAPSIMPPSGHVLTGIVVVATWTA